MGKSIFRSGWAGVLAGSWLLAGCATQPADHAAQHAACFRPECCDRPSSLAFEPHRLNCESIELRDSGRPDQAEVKIAAAIAAAKRASAQEREAAAEVLCFASNDAAQYQEKHGNGDAALAAFKDNVAYCRQRFGTDSIEAAQALYGQASLHLRRNELDLAEPELKTVLEITRQRDAQGLHSFALDASGQLADMRGDRETARALLNQALELKTALFGERSVEVATTCTNLGASYVEAGDETRGWPWYLRAAEIYGEKLGPRHPRYLEVQGALATSYLEREHFDHAETLYREILPSLAETYGPGNEHYLSALNDYGVLAFRRGSFALALERFTQVLSTRRKTVTNSVTHGWTALNAAKAKMLQSGCTAAKSYRVEARTVLAALTPKRRGVESDAAVTEFGRAVREFELECAGTRKGKRQ